MKTDDPEVTGFCVRNAQGRDVKLAMQELWLTGQVLPVGARLVVRHVFRSAEKAPVEAVYAFALPRDAALRKFRIEGDGFRVESGLRPAEEARELYEKGVEAGHLATLATQYRDGLVNLSVGNLKPNERVTVYLEVLAGTEARDGGYRFRFPFTLAPTYHPKARMVEAQSGVGELELPEEEFGDLLLPPFHEKAGALHRVGFDLSIHGPAGETAVASPSHAVRVEPRGKDGIRLALATEADVPNRDLVLDVSAKSGNAMVFASTDARGKGQFAVVLPAAIFGKPREDARRVVFVLDRSGSMDGLPLEQAKAAIRACLAVLSPRDLFGAVAFDNENEVLSPTLWKGTAENRKKAGAFLERVAARGGTELSPAIREAARLLGGEGGDLFVVTDGQVAATEAILGNAQSLGVRLHVLGIGSASQDRFLTRLARDTGGISRYLTARERVDTAAVDLFASAGSFVARMLSVEGRGFKDFALEPVPPTVVFAGVPVVLFGETGAAGTGRLSLSWTEPEAGSAGIDLAIPRTSTELAETLFLLRGARLLTDADAGDAEAGEYAGSGRGRMRGEDRVTALSRKFGLASRRLSLVAVVKRAGDVGGPVPRTRVVPVGMPEDTSFSAYFQRSSMQRFLSCKTVLSEAECDDSCRLTQRMFLSARSMRPRARNLRSADTTDQLIVLAIRLEPDGGMPGGTDAERYTRSFIALLFFVQNGHTLTAGAFRTHVRKLLEYLDAFPADRRGRGKVERLLADLVRDWGGLDEILRRIRSGETPPGDYSALVKQTT